MLCQLIGSMATLCFNASNLFAWTHDTAMPLFGIGMALVTISERLTQVKRAVPSANL
jgi:hypothetical protein